MTWIAPFPITAQKVAPLPFLDAAMSAETEQKTQDTDADEYLAFLTLQPLSSPIDGFGSPSVPHPLPPSDRTLRSQSVRTSPRLQLVSSNMLSQGRTTRSGSIIPMGPSTAGLEEVDELDEFDDQLPADLDCKLLTTLDSIVSNCRYDGLIKTESRSYQLRCATCWKRKVFVCLVGAGTR